jgi:hypothetical protein
MKPLCTTYANNVVTHSYNHSYLGIRDQEDHGSKPAQAKSSQNPISTNKKLGVMAYTCQPSICEAK